MIVKASRCVGVSRADKDVFAFLDREKKDGVGDRGGKMSLMMFSFQDMLLSMRSETLLKVGLIENES